MSVCQDQMTPGTSHGEMQGREDLGAHSSSPSDTGMISRHKVVVSRCLGLSPGLNYSEVNSQGSGGWVVTHERAQERTEGWK